MAWIMKLLTAEQVELARPRLAAPLVGLRPRSLLDFHGLLLRLFENLNPFRISRRVNQVEMRPVQLRVQHDRCATVGKPAYPFHVARIFLHGDVFSILLRKALHLRAERTRAEQPSEALLSFLVR